MVKIYILSILICVVVSILVCIVKEIVQRLYTSYGRVEIDLTGEKDKMTIYLDDEAETIANMKYLRLKVAKKTDS